jgi:cobyrinic acid a,c-diamide synthase
MNGSKNSFNIPRIMIAAPKSGSGKTLITCALLGALKLDKKEAAAFKCGPDYIDPMFHRTVLGVPSENLDIFFDGEDGVRNRLREKAKGYDIAVIEGVMGLYDGMSADSDENSAYHIAKTTGTPIILVIDAKGMGRSVCALIRGFLDLDTQKLIRGVILNRVNEAVYNMLKPVIEKETGIKAVGFFPEMPELKIESRHLGLKMPDEINEIKRRLEAAARQMIKTGGYSRIFEIAAAAETLKISERETASSTNVLSENERCGVEILSGRFTLDKAGLTLAVARDEAFCFYYQANLDMFEKAGIAIEFFSPLHDKNIPENADGLLLGGGYPELYVGRLSENESMRKSIKAAISNGMPSLAECGGFMYLHDAIKIDGKEYQMAGVVKGKASNTGRLVRFGYVEIEEKEPVFLKTKSRIRGHEFHYFDSTDNGSSCVAAKPANGKSWECVHSGANHFWGFAHLYYPSAPKFTECFIKEMKKISDIRRGKIQAGI